MVEVFLGTACSNGFDPFSTGAERGSVEEMLHPVVSFVAYTHHCNIHPVFSEDAEGFGWGCVPVIGK